METTMRKLQHRYRRAMQEMDNWDGLQSQLLSSFTNATSIIHRLQVLADYNNYGSLHNVTAIKDSLLAKQLESLENYFCQMRHTLKEFHGIAKSIDKIATDANQLVKSGSGSSPSSKQMQLRIGTWSSLKICLDGLKSISEMHQAEFALKSAIVSSLTWKCSSAEISDLKRLLIDQPNISKNEVQSILDLVFADEIS